MGKIFVVRLAYLIIVLTSGAAKYSGAGPQSADNKGETWQTDVFRSLSSPGMYEG